MCWLSGRTPTWLTRSGSPPQAPLNISLAAVPGGACGDTYRRLILPGSSGGVETRKATSLRSDDTAAASIAAAGVGGGGGAGVGARSAGDGSGGGTRRRRCGGGGRTGTGGRLPNRSVVGEPLRAADISVGQPEHAGRRPNDGPRDVGGGAEAAVAAARLWIASRHVGDQADRHHQAGEHRQHYQSYLAADAISPWPLRLPRWHQRILVGAGAQGVRARQGWTETSRAP